MKVPPVLCYSENKGFHLELEIGSRPGEPPSLERRDSLIEMVSHSIKNLSKTGVAIDIIRDWVLENLPPPGMVYQFVMSIPVPMLNLISRGSLAFGGIPGPDPE
jgi:hypothetical protein